MNQRVLVCGGRDYVDAKRVAEVLDRAHVANRIVMVIHGAASGADTLASAWAACVGVPQQAFDADWSMGKKAGPLRNQRMLDEGRPDIVIAFPGGRGTDDMKRRAEAAGVPLVTIRATPPHRSNGG